MSIKLLTKYHIEFRSLKAGCTVSSGSTLVKMAHCWKSHVVAYMFLFVCLMGAQWLSGGVLDSKPRGRGFEPHRRLCVVVLEQDTYILA